MKALPLLDHVMLWVARIFSAQFVLVFLYVAAFGPGRPSLHGTPVDIAGAVIWSAVLIVSIIWNIGLWNLDRMFFRVFLGITALLNLILNLGNFARGFAISDAFQLIFFYMSLCGLSAILWVTIRPPTSLLRNRDRQT